jgi:hypothetical protein
LESFCFFLQSFRWKKRASRLQEVIDALMMHWYTANTTWIYMVIQKHNEWSFGDPNFRKTTSQSCSNLAVSPVETHWREHIFHGWLSSPYRSCWFKHPLGLKLFLTKIVQRNSTEDSKKVSVEVSQ